MLFPYVSISSCIYYAASQEIRALVETICSITSWQVSFSLYGERYFLLFITYWSYMFEVVCVSVCVCFWPSVCVSVSVCDSEYVSVCLLVCVLCVLVCVYLLSGKGKLGEPPSQVVHSSNTNGVKFLSCHRNKDGDSPLTQYFTHGLELSHIWEFIGQKQCHKHYLTILT